MIPTSPYCPWTTTIVIPFRDAHPESAAWLELCVAMWLAQNGSNCLLLVDTGSRLANTHRVLMHLARDHRIEVALHQNKWPDPHPADTVAQAMDFATSRCQTPRMFLTHGDAFPLHRDVIASMHGHMEGCDVAGWEMSPRHEGDLDVSRGCMGTVCTMVDVAAIDRAGASWSIRRAHHRHGVARDTGAWPDTETCFARDCERAGVRFKFLGRETNWENQRTEHWLHSRSMGSLGMQDRHHQAFAEATTIFGGWGKP